MATRTVLSDLHRAGGLAFPVSVYAALVVRQLDHQSLRGLPKVFLDLDVNGSGELEFDEVRTAFERIFGAGSQEVADIERTFRLLDLDGSGTLDYTEFCAAALCDRIAHEDLAMKAAFKAFDIHDDNGRITRTEFEEVLSNANVSLAQVAADRVFSEFDADGDGTLDFEEWKAWVAHLVSSRQGAFTRFSSGASTEAASEAALSDIGAFCDGEVLVRHGA
uniref:EF-hand domain-containing protein n=1 Tax=Zooxanthella nutricula TaxID=1333877 RepID=A0A7S2HWE0_9DINO